MSAFANCTEVSPRCPIQATTYGYRPNLGADIFFTVFYGVCGLFQLGYGLYFRSWTFFVSMTVGAFMEMVGYIGRLQLHDNPWSQSGFRLQIVLLILAPVFVAAGVYLTLKHVILYLGPEHSRLKPRLFTWIFIGCDIASLIMQAVGGGVAAAAGRHNKFLLNAGDNVIVAGIAFQVVTMATCGLLGLDFFVSFFRRGRGTLDEKANENGGGRTKIKITIGALVCAYTTVLVRCIYR